MECGNYEEIRESMARGPCAVGLQLKFGGERGVPLGVASRLPRKPARPVVLEPPPDARNADYLLPSDAPFMNDMDEITYWIHTKRAPCLMNYDNLIKKQSEVPQCSKTEQKCAIENSPSPKKRKKKRKLPILDDSGSAEREPSVYFRICQTQNRHIMNNCKSESLGSNIDFNINNTLAADKPKRAKLQKNSRTTTHKKKKVVTSTPKTTVNLRRSLRQAQQSNNNMHLNTSFEIFNSSGVNGALVKHNVNSGQKPAEKVNKSTEMLASGDQTVDNKRNTNLRNKSKNTPILNGQFEDLSDVSGFTANYIRSTKMQSSKTPRKLRCKSSRTLVQESQQSSQNEGNMVICMNKAMNTGLPKSNVLNCSTDSSQNVMTLVTTKNNDKSAKVDKSTSLLKFIDTRAKSKDVGIKNDKKKSKTNLNVSFQSQSSGTSRYPKRYKNHTDAPAPGSTDVNQTTDKKRKSNKNCIEFNNSDKKENPEEKVSRTRSGRNVCAENSVLVVNNSTEQVSSVVSMNVASPALAEKKTRRHTTRQVRGKKSNKSGQSLQRDSMRDKSGFTACFSESDDDSEPLAHRKYFCS